VAHFGEAHFGMDHMPPDAIVCTVTGNQLFINGYYAKDLKADEMDEFNKYMDDLTTFNNKMKEMHERREKEEFHLMKLFHRFKRDSKFEDSQNENFNEKQLQQNQESSDPELPTPPEKPSFCKKPEEPLVFGGGCMVLGNKVYVHDRLVRDLTSEEATQMEEFKKKHEEYVHKWREVMGMRMQMFGPQAHPYYRHMRGGMPPMNRMGPNYHSGETGPAPQSQENEAHEEEKPDKKSEEMVKKPQRMGDRFGEQALYDSPMGPQGPMEYGPKGNQNENMELPEEPQPPKICAVIM